MPTIWPKADEMPVLVANAIVSQLTPGPDGVPEECVVSLGYAPPPIVLGSEEERAEALRALGAVSVITHVRVSLNRSRLQEIINVLQRSAAQWDQATTGWAQA